MKIPQLIQEIIDYYLWKNGIKKVNMEYILMYSPIVGGFILYTKKDFYYNWRLQGPFSVKIYHPLKKREAVAKLPPRYIYSNTKEQLKSLFF